jgi:hypothetical protein
MAENLSGPEDLKGVPLGLEVRLAHVPQVLTVDLKRYRRVTHDPELVRVVHVKEVTRALLSTSCEHPPGQLGEDTSAKTPWRDEVEPELEAGPRRDAKGKPAHVAVGIAVRDERKGHSPNAHYLHRRVEASALLGEDAEQRSGGGYVARSVAALASQRVDAANQLGVEAEARVEREAPPVHAAEGDPSGLRTVSEKPSRRHGVTRQPEGPWEHARAPAGDESDRDVGGEPVDSLVLAAVAGEDVDTVAGPAKLLRQLGGLHGTLGQHCFDRSGGRQLALDGQGQLRRHPARLWVDD